MTIFVISTLRITAPIPLVKRAAFATVNDSAMPSQGKRGLEALLTVEPRGATAGLARVRVHDLRHTYAQRLRDAGVAEEDRALLLGHAITSMPQHYATATIARLVDAANKVTETRDRTTLLRSVNS